MMEFFYRKRVGYILGVCVKTILGWFQGIKLEWENVYTFSLPERELF